MKYTLNTLIIFIVLSCQIAWGQEKEIIDGIVHEATENSQLEKLAHELLDVIGPRLVGTPQMHNAHNWAKDTYEDWGVQVRREQWGDWRGWERGITHIDLISPRIVSLEGRQLAWSPSTPDGGVTGEAVVIPKVDNPQEFEQWLSEVEGKFVLISMDQPTGRPDYNWEEFATEESYQNMKNERAAHRRLWSERIANAGLNNITLVEKLEEAEAAGIIISNWSKGFGTNKVFDAKTKTIPMIDLGLEDYGMLFRMAENGVEPVISVTAESRELGRVPAFNTIGEIRGTEKPDEYVVLSAHFDSWDGGTGATDNGTGTITMMEVVRILQEIYPNPKRTILVGHWGSEEQGLNGSRAFVKDHLGIVDNIQVLFNQDSGTGRVVDISGQGFVEAYDYLGTWLSAVPDEISDHITTTFPGLPGSGGSDHASFVTAGVPAFNLRSLDWDYRTYTWHTNRDTYDKIVFDDVRNNVILTAILAYMASEDQETASRKKRVMPRHPVTGKPRAWPVTRDPNRNGGN
ncbi:MAG: M20/M25/M40 family metallo-hydrolase [Balneolales bacterium]